MQCLLGAVALLAAHWAIGTTYLDGFRLDVGTVMLPAPRWFVLALLLVVLGLPAAVLLAVAGWALLGPERLERLRAAWAAYPDRRSLLLVATFGLLLPLAVRSAVLGGAPVTDDEASYRFGAELFASLRTSIPSPPMRLFHEHGFVVNDGRLYSVYFPGWPLLLAVGVWLGLPALVNPVLCAATGVAVFLVARGWWGGAWARVAAGLFVLSPFVVTTSATLLSHTAALFALAWLLWCVQRVGRPVTPAWASAGAALAFSLAFVTRPTTALGIGGPLLVLWVLHAWRQGPAARWRQAAAFAGVALACAGAFLAFNDATYGSPFMTGYEASLRHLRANGYRFAAAAPQLHRGEGFLYFFVERDAWRILAQLTVGLLRVAVDGLGWPAPVALLLAACARSAPARWLVAGVAAFLLVHVPLQDAGIDSFGPVHFFELMLPLVLLVTDGLRTAWRVAGRVGTAGLVPAGVVALGVVAAVGYVPPRWLALARLAADVRSPTELVERSVGEPAVVFVVRPFAPPCTGRPARHFVFMPPVLPPVTGELGDMPVVWVNHISIPRDRAYMRLFPERRGYLLTTSPRGRCPQVLVPLEEATAEAFPPAVPELPGDEAGPLGTGGP